MVGHSKAMVTLEKIRNGRAYRPTVYMGIDCDSGPSEPTLLEDVTDLYINFNSFSKSNSYIMAEFCLLKGYKVLGQRVNTLTQPSSSRKFVVDGRVHFASPNIFEDYSELPGSEIYDFLDKNSSSYSVVMTFDDSLSSEIVRDDFIVSVPKFTMDSSSSEYNTSSIILAGPYWSDKDKELDQKIQFNPNRSRILGYSSSLKPNTLTVSKFKEILEEFFVQWCNLKVERIGNTSSYYIESYTNLNNIEFIDCTTYSGEEFVSSESSKIGYENNLCRLYNNNKVCTVYSKHYNSLDDITVDISTSSEMYNVFVTRVNSEGVPIYSESFFYSTDPNSDNYISKLSFDSELINFEIHDGTKSFDGEYKLKGGLRISEVSDFNKMVQGEIVETDYPIDFCVDNNESADRQGYLNWLIKCFPRSLVFTDFVTSIQDRVVQISPKIEFYDTESSYVMKGFAYLLYLLPEDRGSGYRNIKVIDDGTDLNSAQNYIEEGDYGIQLVGVKSRVSSILPIKSSIFITCLNNLIVSEQYSTLNDFYVHVSNSVSALNSYLETGYEVYVNSASINGRSLSADLTVKVETQIFGNYQVIANVSW